MDKSRWDSVINHLLVGAVVLVLASMFAPTGLVLGRGALLKGLVGSYSQVPGGHNARKPYASQAAVTGAGGCHVGPSKGDPVDAATGMEEYSAGADVAAYNPYGLPVSYARTFSGASALDGYGSAGLPVGWVDNYDYAVVVNPNDPNCSTGHGGYPSCWAQVFFLYPNGSSETLTPLSQSPPVSGGSYQVTFKGTGAPFTAVGTASTYNNYSKFVVTYQDGTQWTFSPDVSASVLLLDTITPLAGKAINLHRAATYPYAINTIDCTAGSTATLLTFAYTNPMTMSPQLSSVTDPSSRSVSYTWNTTCVGANPNSIPQLCQVSQLNHSDLRWKYHYNNTSTSSILLDQITVPDPTQGNGFTQSASINYDTGGRVTSLIDASLNKTQLCYNYDPSTWNTSTNTCQTPNTSLLQTRVDIFPNGSSAPAQSWVEKYDSSNRATGTIYSVDNHNPLGTTDPVTGLPDPSTLITYGDSTYNPERPTVITDAAGRSTKIKYKQTTVSDGTVSAPVSYGNVLSIAGPMFGCDAGLQTGKLFTWIYNDASGKRPAGEVTAVQDAQFDTNNMPTAMHPATSISYGSNGLVSSITTPAPFGSGVSGDTVTSSFAYTSGLNQISSVTEPGSSVSGGVPSTVTTNYTYDTTERMGQPLTVKTGGSIYEQTQYTYDNVKGYVNSVKDGEGNTTNLSYESDTDDLYEVLSPATTQSGPYWNYTLYTYSYPGGPVTYVRSYDETGSGVPIRTSQYSYCPEGEVAMVANSGTGGASETVTYGYDAAARLRTLQNGRSNTTTYNYNTGGLLQSVLYPLVNLGTGFDEEQYSYNPDGQVKQTTDGNGRVTTYTYEGLSGYLTQVTHGSGDATDVTLLYDNWNRLFQQSNGTASRVYDLDNNDWLMDSTTSYYAAGGPTGLQVGYTYTPDGQRSTMSLPGSLSQSYTYDTIGRLCKLTDPYSYVHTWNYLRNGWIDWQKLNGTSAYTQYTYDAAGEVTHQQDERWNGSSYVTLSDFQVPSYNGMTMPPTVGYDGAGNLNQVGVTVDPSVTTVSSGTLKYSYDGLDRLTQESNGRWSGTNWYNSFDANDNPTTFRAATMGGNSFSFNADDQNTTDTNTFDGNGNPTTYRGGSGSYDKEDRLTGYGGLTAATYGPDGLRASKSTSSGTTWFVYDDGGDLVEELNPAGSILAVNAYGADGLVSRHSGGSSVFYEYDVQGSVAHRISASGGPPSNDLYDAWGNALVSGSGSDPFTYCGQYGYYADRDASNGLLLCTNRYYDPGRGRFLNRDPIRYGGGYNLYGYVAGNPANVADPDGTADPTDLIDLYDVYQFARKPSARGAAQLGLDVLLLLAPPGLDEAGHAGAEALTHGGAELVAHGAEGAASHAAAHGGGEAATHAPAVPEPRGGTYQLEDPHTGEVVRTGRSKNLPQREKQHQRDPTLGQFQFKVDKHTDDYAAQRGREQIIHDLHKPRLNKIRPISPKNPRCHDYMAAGRKL